MKQKQSIKILSAGDMSGNLTSKVYPIEYFDNIAIQMNFTGSPTGTFAVQVSLDHLQDAFGNVLNAGNWVSIVFSAGTPVASGSAGSIAIDILPTAFPYIRVTYAFVSGTGSLDVWAGAKLV